MGANLFGADLQGFDISGANLQGADLPYANLQGAKLTDANLSGATLTDATLVRANLTRANLFGADLRRANFYGAILTDVQLDATTEFGGHSPYGFDEVDLDALDELDLGDSDDFAADQSAWMFRQLQRLSRQNALPDQARQTYLSHKDIRRKEQWANAPIPGPVRYVVWRTKAGYWTGKQAAKSFLVALFEREQGDRETVEPDDDGEDTSEPDDWTTTETEIDIPTSEPWRNGPATDDSSPDSWLNLLGWARAATSGATMRYGESPWRVVTVSLATIVGFGLLYPFVGGMEQTQADTTGFAFAEVVSLSFASDWARILFENLYFSAVTFTTLGYGDIQPASQTAKLLASVESLLGALLMALLVFVLGRRTTW